MSWMERKGNVEDTNTERNAELEASCSNQSIPPDFEKLKYDYIFKLSNPEFAKTIKEGFQRQDNNSKIDRLRGVNQFPQTLTLARLAHRVYKDIKKEEIGPENAQKFEERVQLPPGWKLLTTASKDVWKGATNKYFGSAYYNSKARQIVIAHRGTKNVNALWTDFKGICCNEYVDQMSSACSFAEMIYKAVQDNGLQDLNFFCTGHSLGGWLAQVTTFSLKYLTVVNKYFKKIPQHLKSGELREGCHVHTEVFESPGCKEMLMQMARDFDIRYDGKTISVEALDISSYLAAPNRINCCNEHVGQIYRMFHQDGDVIDAKERPKHYIREVLEALGNPNLEQVRDWPLIRIFGEEYKMFKKSTIVLDENSAYCPIRYQSQKYNENEWSVNVFTATESRFIKHYHQLLADDAFKPQSLFKEGTDEDEINMTLISEMLTNLELKDTSVISKGIIRQQVPFVKLLLCIFPTATEKAKMALAETEARRRKYDATLKDYRDKIETLSVYFDASSDTLGLQDFRYNTEKLFLIETDGDIDVLSAMVRSHLKSSICFYYNLETVVMMNEISNFMKLLKSTLPNINILIDCKLHYPDKLTNAKQVLRDIMQFRFEFKIILVASDKNLSKFIKDLAELNDKSLKCVELVGISWNCLSKEGKQYILDKKLIRLQARSENISLNDFLGKSKEKIKIKDPPTLERLTRGEEVSVGTALDDLKEISNYYIPRTFYIPTLEISKNIFKSNGNHVLVLIGNIDKFSLNQLGVSNDDIGEYPMQTNRKIVFLDSQRVDRAHRQRSEGETLKIFKSICDQNKTLTYCLIKYDFGKCFLLRKKGSFIGLRHFLNLDKMQINVSLGEMIYRQQKTYNQIYPEKDILNILDEEKTIIISDKAGTGKSTILSSLALNVKHNIRNAWVLNVNLNSCSSELEKLLKDKQNFNNDNSHVLAVSFLVDNILSKVHITPFEIEILKGAFLNAFGSCILFVDGFDEISPNYETITIEWLKALQETNVKNIIVSTRPHTQRQLENALDSFSYTMLPFSTGNQQEFLVNFWKTKSLTQSEDLLQKQAVLWVGKFSEKISDNENQFMGIALQCKLLGDYSSSRIQDVEDEKFTLVDLLEDFVDKKFEIYNSDKRPSTESNITAENQKAYFTFDIRKEHWKCASQLLLREEILEELFGKSENDKNKHNILEVEIKKVGLIQESGKNVQFLHRVYAEYLFFEYFIYLLTENERKELNQMLFSEILVGEQMGIVRAFINEFLKSANENSLKNHLITLIHWYMDSIENPLEKEKITLLNRSGQTALMVISTENQKNILNIIIEHLSEKDLMIKLKSYLEERGFNNNTVLHWAAFNGNIKLAEFLVNAGIEVNVTDKLGWTPLHIASDNGHRETVLWLMQNGGNTNGTDQGGWTPLHIASRNGHNDTIISLIDNGANINATNQSGRTPLYFASENGHCDSVLLLIENGADVEAADNNRWTSLHIASRFGHTDTILSLIKNGADVNGANNLGETPLYFASENGHPNTVLSLILYGGNVNAAENDGCTPLYIASTNGHRNTVISLIEYGADVNVAESDGCTPLLAASENGHRDTVLSLIKSGADVNAAKNEGCTPLYIASQNGHRDTVLLLIEYGANVNAAKTNGCTPLYVASQNGHRDIVFLLIRYRADVHAAKTNGSTPLYIASQNGHPDTALLLIEYGADVNYPKNNGWTSLHIASRNGHRDTVLSLVQNGSNVNAEQEKRWAPLHMASENGHRDIALLLIENGANVNATNIDGWTSLHLASQNGHSDTVLWLIKRGANVNSANINGSTSLYTSSAHGHMEVIKVLIRNGADVNRSSVKKWTPLGNASSSGRNDIVIYLLDAGAFVNTSDFEEDTPLHEAAAHGYKDVVTTLLGHGANVNAINMYGNSPLHDASLNNHKEIASILLQSGALLNLTNNNNATPLILAVEQANLEILKVLIEYNADIKTAKVYEWSPFHLAAAIGEVDMVRLLGSNLNTVSGHSLTSYIVAALEGNQEVALMVATHE